jgi:hypothetical protein
VAIVQQRVLGAAMTLAWLGVVPAVVTSAADDAPPPEGIVCPSIEEDGMLCASDPLGLVGNCTGFVAAADRLGALYRTEIQKHPESKGAWLSTSWWGCGPPTLYDVKRLLVRLGSPAAMAVLKTEPYRSLPEVPSSAAQPPDASFSCIDLQNPVDRNLCAGVKLQAARTDHQNAFDACKTRVASTLRDDLLNSEQAFESQMKALCNADTAEAGESAQVRAFDRAECRTKAYRERTAAMFGMHPECAPGN